MHRQQHTYRTKWWKRPVSGNHRVVGDSIAHIRNASYRRCLVTFETETDSGHLPENVANQIHAAAFTWDSAVIMAGILAISLDMNSAIAHRERRCTQFLLALCLCVDTVGSYIWGNEMASLVSLNVSTFEFQFDNLITSCLTSQAALALHFLYAGWRSLSGRCWFYQSLRFELDQSGRAQLSLPHVTKSVTDSEQKSEAEATPDGVASGAAELSAIIRARLRLQQLQQKYVSKCRVFVIPCITVTNCGDVDDSEVALARPAFNITILRPLQRIAETYTKHYFGFVFFVFFVPWFAFALLLKHRVRAIPEFLMTTAMLVAFLAFLSSRRYNLDRVAVRQVVSSFRFAVFTVFLTQWVALTGRRAYLAHREGSASLYETTPWTVASVTVAAIMCSLCLLLDCSPQLPATAQITLTVSARRFVTRPFTIHPFLQAGWCAIFGYWSFGNFYRIYSGQNADCFWDLGAYQVCDATQNLSIFSSLFLLMAQALVSCILVPGKSNFVNASVMIL